MVTMGCSSTASSSMSGSSVAIVYVLWVLRLGLPLLVGFGGVLAEAALFLPLWVLLGLHTVGANVGKQGFRQTVDNGTFAWVEALGEGESECGP